MLPRLESYNLIHRVKFTDSLIQENTRVLLDNMGIFFWLTVIYLQYKYPHDVSKQIPREKSFPSGWKCYKTIGSYVSFVFIEIWSTWEVWRSLKKLELPSATPRATLTHLSCSPNFPRASYLDERTRTYEPVVNYYVHLMSIVELSMVRKLIYLICFDILQSKWYRNALVGVPDDKTNSEKRLLWQTLYVWLKNVKLSRFQNIS